MTTYDYRTERKAFMDRLKTWLETDEGAPYKAAIDRAGKLEEPELSRACDFAWDMAEVEFEHRHPEQRMRYPKPTEEASNG